MKKEKLPKNDGNSSRFLLTFLKNNPSFYNFLFQLYTQNECNLNFKFQFAG